MSRKEIEEFVKLRIANNYLFSGRKNTSKWGWRYVKNLKESLVLMQKNLNKENITKEIKYSIVVVFIVKHLSTFTFLSV